MKTTAITLFVLSFSTLVACGGESPAPKQPETSVPEAGAPETVVDAAAPVSSADTAAADAAAPAPVATPAPAGPALKETLGTIAKIEIQAGGKKKSEITKAADVDALVKAIGTDQVATGAVRKCPDELVVVLKDATGAEKGSVGICKGEPLGPEFWAPKGDRKGIAFADEAAVKKALKIEDKAAAKPAEKAADKTAAKPAAAKPADKPAAKK